MQHIKRTQLRRNRKDKSKFIIRFSWYLFAFVFLLGSYLLFRTNYWGGKQKLVVAFSDVDGGVRVVVLDPSDDRLSNFFIPGDTEVEVSRGLGKWKLKSVWNLGTNEGVGGGVLLSETLTRHVGIPVFIYSEPPGYGLIRGSTRNNLLSIFSSYSTNLTIGDRIGIWFFALKVKNTRMTETDLSKTSFLEPKVLTDGTIGYVVSDLLPESTLAAFADPEVFGKYPKFSIIDNSGLPGFAESFSRVVEVLGGKVLSVDRGNKSESGCTVRSKSKKISEKFVRLFGCRQSELKESNFDTEVSFGSKFTEGY